LIQEKFCWIRWCPLEIREIFLPVFEMCPIWRRRHLSTDKKIGKVMSQNNSPFKFQSPDSESCSCCPVGYGADLTSRNGDYGEGTTEEAADCHTQSGYLSKAHAARVFSHISPLYEDSSSNLIWLHAGTRSILSSQSSMIPSIISFQKWVPSAYHIFTKSRMWVFQEQTWVGGLGAGHSTQEGAHEDLGACLFPSFSGHQDKSFPQMNCSQDLILIYLWSKSFWRLKKM
jgi:hypothetical protein